MQDKDSVRQIKIRKNEAQDTWSVGQVKFNILMLKFRIILSARRPIKCGLWKKRDVGQLFQGQP